MGFPGAEALFSAVGIGVRSRVEQQFGRYLPDIEVFQVLERVAPLLRKARLCIGPGDSHGCNLRPVEHPELDGREVGVHGPRFNGVYL